MPCFKGLAVSIHTPEGPLPEYSIQKQSRYSRITSYIPVPPAKVPPDSLTNKPEQSTFAISITLLTPGLSVPYSTPKPTSDNPYPRPKIVGGIPGYGGDRGQYNASVGPYLPLTTSANETIAAYIYFDGRQKEEVATLLRRGEETWVNSRWVSVPDKEGGGLAEREFLFREVGLERWLNGLDLDGKDAAAKIQRRRERLEKRRRRRKEAKGSDDETAEMDMDGKRRIGRSIDATGDVLRYGADDRSPVERMSDDDEIAFLSDSDSASEPPQPEAAGQIKVALFRVLASGEIKRGEYSPQFDAHDDDEDSQRNGGGEGGNSEADIDHTTSFAKPKTLDPKSISTQTVTGIDGPDKPYAVFTFLYRGERQLQKMGILPTPEVKVTPNTSKRRSIQVDLSNLAPLKSGGTVGFSQFRDNATPKVKSKKNGSADSDDDSDEDIAGKAEDVETKEEAKGLLSPEDAQRQRELADGVRKIKLKRVHSAEPLNADASRKSANTTPSSQTPPFSIDPSGTPPKTSEIPIEPESIIGSPLKKQRASIPGLDQELIRKNFSAFGNNIMSGAIGGVTPPLNLDTLPKLKMEEDEEL